MVIAIFTDLLYNLCTMLERGCSYMNTESVTSEYSLDVKFIHLLPLYRDMIHWHWHEELEIIIIYNGRINFKTNNTDLILHAGQGLLINQNLLHAFAPVEDTECSFFSLTLHPDYIFCSDAPELANKFLSPILSSPSLKHLLIEENSKDTGFMFKLINNAISYNQSKVFGYELCIKSCLYDFWFLLLQHVEAANSTPPLSTATTLSNDMARVKEAIRYIEKKHGEQISLDDIAATLNVSKSECCRCFKRTLGLTPFEYLLKFRIYESTRKLRAADFKTDSLSELAASVGFNSASYYSKLFRKYLNCTPSEYRKQLLTQPSFEVTLDPIDKQNFSHLL